MNEQQKCELCGEPMPTGEEMFKFHGYSGPCPKPPLERPTSSDHAKVTEEDRKLAARWGKEWLTNHLFTRKEAKASLAQLLADAIQDARLKEAESARRAVMRCERDWTWRVFKESYLDKRIKQLKRGVA